MHIPKLTLSEKHQSSQVGYLKQFSVRETYPLHSHDYYEFFYICKGKAIHAVNGTNQLLTQGSLVFIRPDDVHRYEFVNNYDIHLISCGVDRCLIERALTYLGIDGRLLTDPELPPSIILEGTAFTETEHKLDMVGQKPHGEQRRTYFLSILPELLYRFLENSQETDILPVWLSTLLTEMSEPEHFIAGLDTMIQLAGVSQEHLAREFRKHLGMTPTEFINSKRLNHTSSLLLKREHEILDVCYMCGFNSLTYFYRVFRQQFNCTPREFLKKHSR